MRIFILTSILNLFAITKIQGQNPELSNSDEFREKYRPQFHFTPGKNWMNDPNGMVFYAGEYHLFYQYYPNATVWGPMHWGHAISKDLVSWEHLPIALYPDSLGLIFSGSVVVDYQNSSGIGSKSNPAMVAIFTQHSLEREQSGRIDYQTQGIAFSLDRGRTWSKYEKNPVLRNPGVRDFRDPHVFWHKQSRRWIMLLAVKNHVEIYQSKDLKDWGKLSEFGKDVGAHDGVWECPDLFEITIEGSREKKWVMLVSLNPGGVNGGSGTQYFVGDFNGKSFRTSDTRVKWLDYGKDNYAGVTWNNNKDERRIFLGWMSNWQYATSVPTRSWRSAMTVPRTLVLREKDSGLELDSYPVAELHKLRRDSVNMLSAQERLGISETAFEIDSTGLEMDVDIMRTSKVSGFRLEFSNDLGEILLIGLMGGKNEFFIDRLHSGPVFSKDFEGTQIGNRTSDDLEIKMKILFDACSVEIFINGGSLVMTDLFFPTKPYSHLKLTKENGVELKAFKLYHLKSMWESK